MSDRFLICLPYTLEQEGGNDDDPEDPGGRTSRGIEQREYNAYRKSKGEPLKDVWTASDAEIQDIYHISYWEPWCDKMRPGVDMMFFDDNVNEGLVEAVKLLQRVLRVADDGHIGVITLGALQRYTDTADLIRSYAEQRRLFYEGLSLFWKYGHGWLNRTNTIEAVSLKMIGVTS